MDLDLCHLDAPFPFPLLQGCDVGPATYETILAALNSRGTGGSGSGSRHVAHSMGEVEQRCLLLMQQAAAAAAHHGG